MSIAGVMARKPKDDTPKGGWLGPRAPDENGDCGPTGPAIKIAVGVTKKNQWIWRDNTPELVAKLEADREREIKRELRRRKRHG